MRIEDSTSNIESTKESISKRKKAEGMLKESEAKLRNALTMSARQNIQLHRLLNEKTKMQEKIDQYAKQLETRVETLEKQKIPLTSKEKLVLHGLCVYPFFNDIELSEKLKLKRSTVTAIRNRLWKDGWFSIINLPNFYALGCESFSLLHCNFKASLKERKDWGMLKEVLEIPEIVFSNETDDESILIFISRRFADFQKFLNKSSLIEHDILRNNIKPFTFFLS